jgi:hypothetical protein
MLIALLFCASLAAGLFSQPTFFGFSPSEVPGGKTVAVTMYGHCLPTAEDVAKKTVVVGFNDRVNPQGLPVNIALAENGKFVVLSVTTPVVPADSGRRLWMQFNGKKYEGPELTIRGQARELPKEHVVAPVDFGPIRREIRQVEHKADSAIGLAQQARSEASAANDNATAAQRAITDLADMLKKSLGDADTDGTITKAIGDLGKGYQGHAAAIKQLQTAVDDINSRKPPAAVTQQDIDDLNRRVDNLLALIKTMGRGVINPTVQQ